jgi:PIN domain nuclease of toxin-antitoxin system
VAKYLFDTVAFVRHADGKLPRRMEKLIEKSTTEILVSIATFWELAIKPSLGFTAERVEDHLERLGARLLPITPDHTRILSKLPIPEGHTDPFDRMIIAQALEERCPVVSSDQRFPLYESVGLQVIWD